MQTQTITTKLSFNGISVSVGHEFLNSIVNDIPDTPENIKVFEVLSTSTSKDVRSKVACKDTTNRTIVKNLLSDPNSEVLEWLMRNSDALKLIKEKEILQIIASDDIEVIKELRLI